VPAVGSRIRAVLFDVGGTLVREPDLSAWSRQARTVGLDLDPRRLAEGYVEELKQAPGPWPRDRSRATVRFWRGALSRAARRSVPEETAAAFVAADPEGSAPAPLYPDTRPCLDRLRREHRPLGVISNSRSEAILRGLLARAGILQYFAVVLSSGTEGIEKPEAAIFRRAVRRMGVRPAEAVYIGNRPLVDARGARAAGLHGLWLNRGRPGRGQGTAEVRSLLEVPGSIRLLERRALGARAGPSSSGGRPPPRAASPHPRPVAVPRSPLARKALKAATPP